MIGNTRALMDSLAAGETIVDWHVEDAYWHYEVELRRGDGLTLRFTADEHSIAPLFDFYTLAVRRVSGFSGVRGEPPPPFTIKNTAALCRAEWLVPAPELEDELLGNNPHAQYSGVPDAVPRSAIASAILIAGVLLSSTDDRRIAIIASDAAPLNVDLVLDDNAIDDLLVRHEVVWDKAV